MAVGGLTIGQGRGNRITTNRLTPFGKGTETHKMTTILGVTATLLLLANILQAVAAIANKGKVQDTLLELHHAYKDLSTAIAERDHAKAEAKQANQLRDRIERAAKVLEDDRDEARSTSKGQRENIEQLERIIGKLNDERANLYFRNSKGQIAKLHP
jgi:septal ring factor EnvC (AmiA/AmiB activator)